VLVVVCGGWGELFGLVYFNLFFCELLVLMFGDDVVELFDGCFGGLLWIVIVVDGVVVELI